MAARRQLRIFGKDLRCLYKFSTTQSVRVQAARRGKDDPPGVLCPRQRAVLAFEDKNSLPNPCLSTCPLLHGAKPVQYKIPSDRSSRKRPKRSPFQMSGTIMQISTVRQNSVIYYDRNVLNIQYPYCLSIASRLRRVEKSLA